MSRVGLEIALPATAPECQTSRQLLESVVRALPRPPVGASAGWRHAHLRRIAEELFAYAPYDPIDAMLAVQMVCARHAAVDTIQRSTDPSLPARMAVRMRRSAEALLRTATQSERMLRRRQAERNGGGSMVVDVGFDLVALDAVWCEVDPMERGPDAIEAAVPPSPVALCGPPTAPRARYTVCGERIDLVKLETIPAAGTA
jgi:hypothetical protein